MCDSMNNSASRHFDTVLSGANIADAFWKRAASHPNDTLYRYALASHPQATRVWKTETYASAGPKIARIAHLLAGLGVTQGTPVAILSNTRPEWGLVDMAIQTLGGITVSIYQTLTAHEAGFILHDSGASIVFVENEEQAQKILWLRNNDCPIPQRESITSSQARIMISEVVSFEPLRSLTNVRVVSEIIEDSAISEPPPPIPSSLTRESTASYVYTSGTTGPPKGVIQTHGNHLANVEQASLSGVFATHGSLFLYLPLAHSFARLVYYVGFLTSTSLTLPAVTDHQSSKLDLSSIARDIREGSSTVLPSVPRLFEKMASALQARAARGGVSAWILRLCINNARKVHNLRAQGREPGTWDEMIFKGLAGVRRKIKHQLFGPEFLHGISGGAKLDPEVNRFFNALEILICEGYGLTETCVATHVNLPNRYKIESVGPAFPRVEVNIASSDGEISLRGPNITKSYLNRPQATQEAWSQDGWFHTGDIGRLDDEGFLYITDRKKELVITAGGKKIPPSVVEGMLKRAPFISHAFLYGDGKPYCVILLTLNEQELQTMLASRGITVTQGESLAQHAETRRMTEALIREINKDLASYESIKNFSILPEDFTIENGLLTPTMKMKRRLITEKYRATIDALYA